MGRAEWQKTIESLKVVLFDFICQMEVDCASYEVKCCPRCGCAKIVRKGNASAEANAISAMDADAPSVFVSARSLIPAS